MDIKKFMFQEFSRDKPETSTTLSDLEFDRRVKIFNDIFTSNDSSEVKTDIINNDVQTINSDKAETIGSVINIENLLPKTNTKASIIVPQKTYEDGLADGYINAKKELDTTQINLLTEQNTIVTMLLEKINYLGSEILETLNKDFANQMASLASQVASKIAARILEKNHVDILQEQIHEILSKLVTSQNVIVELNPITSVKMRPILMSPNDNHNYKIEIVDNEALEISDCKVSWGDGAFDFIKQNREQLINNIVSQFLSKAKL